MTATGFIQESENTVLIIGSGGREHALAMALAHSPRVSRISIAPGNPGMLWGIEKPVEFLNISMQDVPALLQAARHLAPNLIVVGSEVPLANGVIDRFTCEGFLAFGPSQAAAQLEASKSFAKSIMDDAHVATARHDLVMAHMRPSQMKALLETFTPPYVIKADGLAAGKGVTITADKNEALLAIQQAFQAEQSSVLIEQFMPGQELSVLAVCDGEHAIILPPAQDYKRLRNDQQGPNTGGMGAICPVSWVTRPLLNRVLNDVINPVLKTMKARGTPFRGVLYAGLMIDADQNCSVVEFNCRFGDPETQVILPLLDVDLYWLLSAAAQGDLTAILAILGDDPLALAFPKNSAITVVMAAPGYPENTQNHIPVTVFQDKCQQDLWLLSAGLAQSPNEGWVSAGGRVINVVSVASSLAEARVRAYDVVSQIGFDGAQWRTDIGGEPLPAFLPSDA
ncbi:MAG: phosphoribosylamine--glycine ligase [Vampirovibrionales bacterium]|nr:phosphoribosylamine--glycine ligase [Vampirovibrionales bacterium]